MEHEYVHMLQWEGRGASFGTDYIGDMVNAGFNYGPGLPLESLAYIWEYQSRYLAKWEGFVWDVWHD